MGGGRDGCVGGRNKGWAGGKRDGCDESGMCGRKECVRGTRDGCKQRRMGANKGMGWVKQRETKKELRKFFPIRVSASSSSQ